MTANRIVIVTGDNRLSEALASALVNALSNETAPCSIVAMETTDIAALSADARNKVICAGKAKL